MRRWLNGKALSIAATLVLWATQGESHAGVTQVTGREVASDIDWLRRIVAPRKRRAAA